MKRNGKRFAVLDQFEVWQARELQSMTRLADAALSWEEGPWDQRTHALAGWVELWHLKDQSIDIGQLVDIENAWSKEHMEALWPRLTAQLSKVIASMQAARSDIDRPEADTPLRS